MKYQFYAIVFDVAGNITPVGSSVSPAKSFVTNIQKVTGISINPSGSVTKNIGENFTISATVSPSDANNKTINWNSSNKTIATVDTNGKVTCLAAGTTTITVTATDGSGISASLELTVRNPINSLTLDKDQTTILKDGYTSTVTATTDPANYDGANISWTIADTSIATVTVSGKTATIKSTSKLGQTTLTVSAGGITKTVNVSVVNFVTTTYSYTGTVQQVDLPAGTYKLEVWGAQGATQTSGTRNSNGWYVYYGNGGNGGYSCGILTISYPITVYICVGKQGSIRTGGYNGGGNGQCGSGDFNPGGGGGASHIAIRSGILSSLSNNKSDILLVAGGGGGAGWNSANESYQGYSGGYCGSGGNGGGIEATDGGNSRDYQYIAYAGNGGSQSSAGSGGKNQNGSSTGNGCSYGNDGAFGIGGQGGRGDYGGGAGGGGGYYGGGGGGSVGISHYCGASGGGGSGYINTSKLTDAFMYGYNVSTSNDIATKTYSTTNVSSTPTSNYAKSGDGAARITPVN